MKKSTPIDPEALLMEHGFKRTPLRLALLLVLSQSTKPLTVTELVKKTKKVGADTATLYRALGAFVEAGIIHPLALQKDKVSYQMANSHAHHIMCTDCGTIETVPFCVRDIAKKAAQTSKLFKIINEHRLEFFGTCRKCVRAVR
jgi:Fe2+ or Zn2+ uptake regulation protein